MSLVPFSVIKYENGDQNKIKPKKL